MLYRAHTHAQAHRRTPRRGHTTNEREQEENQKRSRWKEACGAVSFVLGVDDGLILKKQQVRTETKRESHTTQRETGKHDDDDERANERERRRKTENERKKKYRIEWCGGLLTW